MRHPFDGIGKHRLVYAVESNALAIIACRYHYD